MGIQIKRSTIQAEYYAETGKECVYEDTPEFDVAYVQWLEDKIIELSNERKDN